MPAQAYVWRAAAAMNRKMAPGEKRCNSPTRFMAWLKQSSPAVPVSTTKATIRAARISARLDFRQQGGVRRHPGRGRCASDKHNAEDDQTDADPTRRMHDFAEPHNTHERHEHISKRRKGHHEAVVRPGKHQHVAKEEKRHAKDA